MNNKVFDRGLIISNVTTGSGWAPVEDKRNYQAIKENLKCLETNLELNSLCTELMYLEFESNEEKKNVFGYLNSRQVNCMDLINENVEKHNLQGAYHELYDFILCNRCLSDKPISIVERIFIRNAIFQIQKIL